MGIWSVNQMSCLSSKFYVLHVDSFLCSICLSGSWGSGTLREASRIAWAKFYQDNFVMYVFLLIYVFMF